MKPLFITLEEHDKIAQFILILIGSNVQKTELKTSDVISLLFYYCLSCKH